jgi:hypothetical protein
MRSLLMRAVGIYLLLGNAPMGLAIQKPLDNSHLLDGLPTPEKKVIRPLVTASRRAEFFDQMLGGNGEAKVDQHSGAIRVLSGFGFGDARTDFRLGINAFDAEARQVVRRYSKMLRVNPSDLRLDERATVFNKSEQFLKYRVYRNGIAVQDAMIDFRFKYGRLVQVVNQSFAEAQTDERPMLQDLTLQTAGLRGLQITQDMGAFYRVEKVKRGYRLVRVQQYEVKSFGQRVIAQVEAATGRIFEIAPTKFYAAGTARAQVHPRLWKDELVEAGLSELDMKSGTTSIKTDLEGAFEVPASTAPQVDGLVGTRVNVHPMTGTAQKTTGTFSGNAWQVLFAKEGAAPSHEDKAIAQNMVYVHTNKIIQHAKRYISAPWLEERLTANANLGSSCNAHWDGSTINMYSAGQYSSLTCANTGLIADVIYHEWGHGLDDNTGGIEDGAYSEGFGDICSLMITGSPELAPYFTIDGMVVRNMEPDAIYPRDKGEVHDEGLIIGSTFYDMFQALEATYGREKALDMIANFAFKSIQTASKYTDVYDALLVIDDNDGDLSNGTPNLCLINEAFTAHGLADKASACLLGEFAAVDIDDRSGNRNGILEPGESAEVNIRLFNNTPNALAELAGTVSLVNPPSGVSLISNELVWGSVAEQETVMSSTGFEIEVASSVACGTTIPFAVKLESSGKTVMQNAAVMTGLLMGEPQEFTASALPVEIKDKAKTTIPLNVTGSGWSGGTKVHQASLSLAISHSYVGDLKITLQSPSGKEILLYEGEGSGDTVNLELDLTNDLASEAGEGTWNVVVEDLYEVDVGTVDGLSFTATPALFRCER